MDIANSEKFPTLSVEYELKLDHNQCKKKDNPIPPRKIRKVPYVTRLLALAYHLQGLINNGIVSDYADIARLSNLSRPRITQIMNLTMLAPMIQEEILFFPSSLSGINERNLREILQTPLWGKQAKTWEEIKANKLIVEEPA